MSLSFFHLHIPRVQQHQLEPDRLILCRKKGYDLWSGRIKMSPLTKKYRPLKLRVHAVQAVLPGCPEPEDNEYIPRGEATQEQSGAMEEDEEDPFAVFYQKQAEEEAVKEAAAALAFAAKKREETTLLDRAREQEMEEALLERQMEEALLERESQITEAEAALEEIEREERITTIM
ncbi:hypothetical protein PHYBLDRAFT_163121 [Phycomyces blakesleeanus NRRL 1555(-)]|uniref:Uncharacterized protein n=1 Tax=Phycomyces blakesleeanus (strain ATCC 8743b / DSM 1359 / FGSC 10004 / NBRC 33097 / NRRL 1555) TaxID=763407 RepID=A0A167QQJ4_PHYB8|nr:hypothetical protein PHYBLDRAFT_163121 [Phycomyces blakesleeanus NRRL 1555(-)]OAD80071.1 hypothetical protein PHYBLDRAFT_163121 [Phycomyces blakesleeanus NRRL 1555(-)]|eukprot:XP_018298111.1 hypothetical protein PHYBLDRAFT_163121 [Phycomyces blakesleeanus NRRL 1555(-)]